MNSNLLKTADRITKKIKPFSTFVDNFLAKILPKMATHATCYGYIGSGSCWYEVTKWEPEECTFSGWRLYVTYTCPWSHFTNGYAWNCDPPPISCAASFWEDFNCPYPKCS